MATSEVLIVGFSSLIETEHGKPHLKQNQAAPFEVARFICRNQDRWMRSR